MKTLFFNYSLIYLLFCSLVYSSCTSSDSEVVKENYEIVLTDSIYIDFLGNLKLKDYDAHLDKYLLSNDGMIPILEVNSDGVILNTFQVKDDGPNAVPSPGSIGYFDRELFIYDMSKGFLKINGNEVVVSQMQIPYQHNFLFFPPHLPLIKHSADNIYYITPLTDEDFIDGMGEKFYTNYYHKPLIEKVNIKTGKITPHFEIPEQSIFKDGKNHGIYIPIIKNMGNDWLVSTWFDPVIYLYKEEGDNITLVKTIDLQIEGMIQYEGIDMKDSDKFFEINSNVRPGNINDILFMDDHIIVIYRKGIDLNQQKIIKEKYPQNTHIELERNDPFRAVVLDRNYNVLHSDVLFPSGVYYPNVVNSENEIVALKNSELYDEEGDGITLYKMRLSIR